MKRTDGIGVVLCEGEVLPEWIDVNGHMNVAYYVLAFDLSIDVLWDRFGITRDYIENSRGSTFAAESHVTYQKELLEGERYSITEQIIAYDEKRLHHFQRLYRYRDQALAATLEWMTLHVDLNKRRVSHWPKNILAKIEEFAAEQGMADMPIEAGRQMSVAKPLFKLRVGSE